MSAINKKTIIIALDFANKQQCEKLVAQLDPKLCGLKVGKAMFTRFGPPFVESLINKGFDIFLDLKFHDIPNQVAGACKAAADLGVWMLNVHALGGRRMMEAAREAVDKVNGQKPLLIGVTILTSHGIAELTEIGLNGSVPENVLRLAKLTKDSGLDGVVCSAQEATLLREKLGKDFCLVTPGIRLAENLQDDQRRIVTPTDALALGANYLVIGRPITQAADPLQVLQNILLTI